MARAYYLMSQQESELLNGVTRSRGDAEFLFSGQRSIWRDEAQADLSNHVLPAIGFLTSYAYCTGLDNRWIALGIGLAEGAILDVMFGVQLTAFSNTNGQHATEDWRAWSTDRIHAVFLATLNNAQLYNRVATENAFGLPNDNPTWLFRQVNGPLEVRLEDDLDYNFLGRASSGAFTVSSVPEPPYFSFWGRTYSEWQANGGDITTIRATLIQLTPGAFEEGSVRNTNLAYPPGFIVDHEYGHILSLHWNAPNREQVGLAYSNVIGGDEALGEFIPNSGARSLSLYPDSLQDDLPAIRDEYWADAIANLQRGQFGTEVGQPTRQLQTELVLWSVIQRVISIQRTGGRVY